MIYVGLCMIEQKGWSVVHHSSFPMQGNSPRAKQLAEAIQARLQNLEQQVTQAVSMAVRSGITRPAYTLAGKMEQAQRWLNNPAFDDKGLGQS